MLPEQVPHTCSADVDRLADKQTEGGREGGRGGRGGRGGEGGREWTGRQTDRGKGIGRKTEAHVTLGTFDGLQFGLVNLGGGVCGEGVMV